MEWLKLWLHSKPLLFQNHCMKLLVLKFDIKRVYYKINRQPDATFAASSWGDIEKAELKLFQTGNI